MNVRQTTLQPFLKYSMKLYLKIYKENIKHLFKCWLTGWLKR